MMVGVLTSKIWIEVEMKMKMMVNIDVDKMNKMQHWKSWMKNLITRELPERLIKMLCLMKFVVKLFLNSYIWGQI